MLSGFYLKKFIMKVSVKTRGTHFNPLLLLDPFLDLSVEHGSRPNFAGASTTGYNGLRGEGTNDGSDTRNNGGEIADPQQNQYPLSPFTG